MSAEGYSHLACPNPDGKAYGQRGTGNLCLHGWSGSGHRIRCLRCITCGTDFSERANTPLFGRRSSEDTAGTGYSVPPPACNNLANLT